MRGGSTDTFTEGFFYDDRGRQEVHVSFEGVVTKNLYDAFGRMSRMSFYADESDYADGLISQHYQYVYDHQKRFRDLA